MAAASAPKIDSIDPKIIEAFFAAVRSADEEKVLILLENNIEHVKELVNARDKDGKTPLAISTSCRSNYSVETLTVLHLDVGESTVIDRLLQFGAVIEQLNEASLLFLLEYACYANNLEVIARCTKCISEQNKDVATLSKKLAKGFLAACEKGSLGIIQYLIDLGLDPKQANLEYYATPLHAACMYGQYDVAKLLVEVYKVDVDVGSKYYSFPIILAAVDGHLEILRFLIDNGASLTASRGHRTLLHIVCQSNKKNGSAVMDLLVKAGANIYDKTADDRTLLDIARENKKVDIVQYLEDLFVRRTTLFGILPYEIEYRKNSDNRLEDFPPEYIDTNDRLLPSLIKVAPEANAKTPAP
jgi:ankyrin repeat protein